MLRGDLGGALAGLRGGAAVAHHILCGGVQRVGGLDGPSELLALLGDAAADLGDRARHGFPATAQRACRGGQRFQLVADARHRFEERPPEIIDVQRGRQLRPEALHQGDFLVRIRVRLVVLEFQEADGAVTEAEREHDHAARHRASGKHPFVAQHIVDLDGLAGVQAFRAERRHVDVGFARRVQVPFRAAPDMEQHVILVAANAELPPVHEPVRQRLDAAERIGDVPVRRDNLLHGEDLVELLGGDGLLEDALHEHPRTAEDHANQRPSHGAQVAEREQHDRDGDAPRAERDDFVAQDERLLLVEELVAQQQREVQQQPARQEVREDEERERRQRLGAQPRQLDAHGQRRPREHAERGEHGHDFASCIDERDVPALPHEHRVPKGDAHPHRERARRRAGHEGARERRHRQQVQRTVFRERDLLCAQEHDRRDQHGERDGLVAPSLVHGQAGEQEHEPQRANGTGVDREERAHLRGVDAAAQLGRERDGCIHTRVGRTNDRAADHDAIRQCGGRARLCRRGDAEPDAHRQRRRRAKAGRRRRQLRGERRLFARHTQSADEVDESLPGACDPAHASGRRGRRDQTDEVQRPVREPGFTLRICSERQVRDKHAVRARIRCTPECIVAAPQQRIQVAEQHHGHRQPRVGNDPEHVIEPDALVQRTLRARLDHGTVGERIRERHADLDHVGARRLQPLEQRNAAHRVRMAGRDVRNERLAGCVLQLGEPPGDRVR